MKTFIVFGNHGEIIVNATDGTIISFSECFDSCCDGYNDIKKFDVEEFKTHYNYDIDKLNGQYVDVLDIGLWSDKDVYDKPERNRE